MWLGIEIDEKNMADTRKLYCDESGFTGPDLLNADQPYFVYSSVLIDPKHAAELVQQVRADYKLQGNELKGSRLLKSSSRTQSN